MRLTSVLLFGIGAASAHAGLAGVTGLGDILPDASANYAANAFNDTSIVVHGWNERQNYTLTNALRVDANTVGTWSLSNDAELTIAAGTAIDSHAFYFDPLNPQTVGDTPTKQVKFTFDQKIIGVIYTSISSTNSKLYQSDYLRSNGAAPAFFGSRGLETGESLTVVDNYSVTFNIAASNPGDQVRIVTEAVPEPASMVALALGGLGVLRRRRKA
jgi:hypothetical protein